jgi:hypothetical protein
MNVSGGRGEEGGESGRWPRDVEWSARIERAAVSGGGWLLGLHGSHPEGVQGRCSSFFLAATGHGREKNEGAKPVSNDASPTRVLTLLFFPLLPSLLTPSLEKLPLIFPFPKLVFLVLFVGVKNAPVGHDFKDKGKIEKAHPRPQI